MQLEKLQDQKPECHLEWPNSKDAINSPYIFDQDSSMKCNGHTETVAYNIASLDSRPRRERRPGIPCMRMRVHYPKKGVIRVFVDTVSKINRIYYLYSDFTVRYIKVLYQAKSLLNDTLHCKATDVIGKA